MIDIFSRSRLLMGEEGIETLKSKHVAVFGVGGVGGNCIEVLVRSGIGEITIIDNDVVSLTNINRQIIALHSTIGQLKVDVMRDRLLDINPEVIVHTMPTLIDEVSIQTIDFTKFDYVVDAIDNVYAKLAIIEESYKYNIRIISCMGTGNKLSSDTMKITTIEKTTYCTLARVIRKKLKKRNIVGLTVLALSTKPLKPLPSDETTKKREVPGSVAFVANIAGIMIAGEVVRNLNNIA